MIEARLVYIDDDDIEHTLIKTKNPLLLIQIKKEGLEQAALNKVKYSDDPILHLKASAELKALEEILNRLLP